MSGLMKSANRDDRWHDIIASFPTRHRVHGMRSLPHQDDAAE